MTKTKSRSLTPAELAALPTCAGDGTPIEPSRRRCCLMVSGEDWVTMFAVDDDGRFWEYGLQSGRLLLMDDGGAP